MVSKSIPKAVIFGCAGTVLSADEKVFFAKHNPLGFILFSRNCESPEQVKKLVADLKATLSHETPLVLIDQEGGRVARLKPPHWRASPAAGKFADNALKDKANGKTWSASRAAVYWNARLIAKELAGLGINVNCAPLADVPSDDCHDIIGDRAYGKDPEQVSILAAEMARGLHDGGVLPVLKHIPGHGRAKVDSHEDLPVVDASLDAMRASDFIPFSRLKHIPLGMTAHILYSALDDQKPATLSKKVMGLIRGELGFDGLLMSDDVSMKALKGDFAALTQESLNAGCDLVLHCNGKMEEMLPIAEHCRALDADGERRLNAAWAKLAKPEALDVQFAESNVNGYLQAS
jgi:beta-N-acetylhexosaminidase